MKKLVPWLVIGVLAYLAVTGLASYQLISAMVTCGADMRTELKPAPGRNEAATRALAVRVVDCLDQRKGFFGALLFSREESIASIRIDSEGNFTIGDPKAKRHQ